MMPGSSFMNVLAGSLYGSATAVPMIALLSTAGSSGSYWLSRLVVKVRASFSSEGLFESGQLTNILEMLVSKACALYA